MGGLKFLFLLLCITSICCKPQYKSGEKKEIKHYAGDCEAKWPSPAVVASWAKEELKGAVHFPNSLGYALGQFMSNTRFPRAFGVVAKVETAEDVVKCFQFCNHYGIRPTIKSGGHDYVGRSMADHTFSIDLGRMKNITVNPDDDESPTGASVIVEAGNTMERVYKELDQHGYLMIGGSAHTVAAGGYFTGGGHSPMSRMYGLGVDNVLGFTLVTPEGNIIKQTKNGGQILKAGEADWAPYSDPELFWAVRGGGGVFGVVTSFTVQLHAPPPEGFCQLFSWYPMIHPLFGQVGDKVVESFSSILLNNLTSNWGGYVLASGEHFDIYAGTKEHSGQDDKYRLPSLGVKIPTSFISKVASSFPGPKVTVKGSLLFSLLHVGGCEQAEREGGLGLLKDMYPAYLFALAVNNYSTFWEYEKDVNDPVGYRQYIINRLLQPADMAPSAGLGKALVEQISYYPVTPGGTWTLLGGVVANPGIESAATPDFRTALGSWSAGLGWGTKEEDEDLIATMRKYGETMYTFGKGMYYNEPDYYVENWKEEFWGSMDRYNRLLHVKNKYDPDHVITCHKCVGSDVSNSP